MSRPALITLALWCSTALCCTEVAPEPGVPAVVLPPNRARDQGRPAPAPRFDRRAFERRVARGHRYLQGVVHNELGGVHKYYYPLEDRSEDKLYGVYSASLAYSLLKLGRPRDLPRAIRITEFLLSMQYQQPAHPASGGFHYTLDLPSGRKRKRFVVGTASKAIYTLLRMAEVTGEDRYRQAAERAGDWLLQMRADTGHVRSELKLRKGRWQRATKASWLYRGQVLSAWARLYAATKHPRFMDAATHLAQELQAGVGSQGCYLGDDYRTENPISSSWVVLALHDHGRATRNQDALRVSRQCARELLRRQIVRPGTPAHGGWPDAFSSSGVGWLAEVMSELYLDCLGQGDKGCDAYAQSVMRAAEWIDRFVITETVASTLPNPARAVGGVYWNQQNRYVRTDAVCHALNAYANLLSAHP